MLGKKQILTHYSPSEWSNTRLSLEIRQTLWDAWIRTSQGMFEYLQDPRLRARPDQDTDTGTQIKKLLQQLETTANPATRAGIRENLQQLGKKIT